MAEQFACETNRLTGGWLDCARRGPPHCWRASSGIKRGPYVVRCLCRLGLVGYFQFFYCMADLVARRESEELSSEGAA